MPTYHVTTVAELKTAFDAYISQPEPVIVEIDNDLDFNDSNYYRYDGDFFFLGENNQPFTINGNGHTLANIYLFPNRALIRYFAYTVVQPTINDLKFEVVSNNASIVRHQNWIGYGGDRCAQWIFNRCTFNTKIYSATNPLFVFYTPVSGGSSAIMGFVNCIFNLYISGINKNQAGSSDTADYYWDIFRYEHINYNYNYDGCIIVSGCMFNIRNATNKFIMLVRPNNRANNAKVVFDNNAIFYSDIGLEQPDYITFETMQYGAGDYGRNHHILPYETKDVTTIQNCYIAQFDQYMNLNPDFEKPVFSLFMRGIGTSTTDVGNKIMTSFYDKDKIVAYQLYSIANYSGLVGGGKVDNLNGVLSALTTSQCKDAIALGSVGYIFSQEV